MTHPPDKLQRLLELARKAPDPNPPTTAGPRPLAPGFATRVAARWAASGQRDELDLWDRLSRWGLGIAGAVCLAVLVFRWFQPVPPSSPFEELVSGNRPGEVHS